MYHYHHRYHYLVWGILFALIIYFGFLNSYSFKIEKNSLSSQSETLSLKKRTNPLSGLVCDNYNRRPIAVVLASDPVARPLAGLRGADLVIELPVITHQITRMIAVYVCRLPLEIGSIRSARHDFVPLAMGLDAILVHWGGSHFALEKLNKGVMDNLDALKDSREEIFYRKDYLKPPHNGFTSGERILKAIKKKGYRIKGEFEGYPHYQNSKFRTQSSKMVERIVIKYPYPYNIEYRYDAENDVYLRWRGGEPEIDRNDGYQVETRNIVIMRASSRQIEGQYNDIDLEGEGECQIYQNGRVIPCYWKKEKDNPSSKLYFLDKNNQEIPFVPGQIWIEIIEPEIEVEEG